MAIAPVDWAIFVAFFGFVVLLLLSEESALFEILAGLVALILVSLLDANVFSAQPDFIRFGTFLVWVIVAIALFTHGAMTLRTEVA